MFRLDLFGIKRRRLAREALAAASRQRLRDRLALVIRKEAQLSAFEGSPSGPVVQSY